MKIKTIVLQNFLSYKYQEFTLADKGLVLIEGNNKDLGGANRAGKSSLLEGITWCLFGTTVRGIKADGVINSKIGKDTYVELNFILGDINYKIIRYRKHKKFHDALLIKKEVDGEFIDLEIKSIKDAQEKITNLIGYNYTSFMNSVLFGQGQVEHFASLTDAEKKQVLEKILNIHIYARALEETKIKMKNIQDDIGHIEYKNSIILEQLQKVKQDETKCLIDLEKWDIKKKEKIKELDDRIISLKENDKHFETLRDEKIENVLKEIGDVTEDGIQQQIEESKITIEGFESFLEDAAFDDVTDCLAEILEEVNETELDIRSAVKDIKTKNNSIEEKKHSIDTKCSECQRILTKDDVEPYIQHMSEEISSLEKQKDRSDRKKQSLEIEAKEAEQILVDCKVKKDSLNKEQAFYSELENKLTILKKNLERIEQIKTETNSYKELIIELQNSMKEHEQEKNPHIPILNGFKSQEKEYLYTVTTNEESLREHTKKLDYYVFWKEGFGKSGIPSYLLDDILPDLNEKANHYLNILCDGQLQIELTNCSQNAQGELKEKFTIVVINEGEEQEYNSCSGGEQRLLDVAILLALKSIVRLKATHPINLMIFDEVFTELSSQWIDKVVRLLQEEIKNNSSIFVISHQSEVTDYFDKTVTVVKEDGFSTIQER